MKISLKKLLFIVLTVLSMIFIGACGKKSDTEKKEIIEKFIEVSKNIKSADMVMNMKMEQKGDKDSKTAAIEMSMDASIIEEPLAIKLELGIPFQNTKLEMYIKDGYIYILNPANNQWAKQLINDEINKQFKGLLSNSYELYDVMKDNIDKIDIEEKDGNYIISISKDSEFLKEAILKQLSNMNTAGNQIGDNVNIDNITVTYIVDKNTYSMISSNNTFDMNLINNVKVAVTIDAKYSNLNNVKEIAIPEEALKAQEIIGGNTVSTPEASNSSENVETQKDTEKTKN
ncbi:hypothetical protein OCK72_00555 [Fusobacterium simiae]|uniref:Lipoprotein n=2 Tax=Fusobacterium simiae TaxID=855 RepID=A0ABT4DEV6_FUSSI|nr:DUF6612 family protein [Fusobacterium simiae]MCY7007135.1 hypothetical protein [Fusobacterium simiae]